METTITPEALHYLAALNAATSNDKFAPILSAVNVTVECGTVIGYATDRYIAARVIYTPAEAPADLPPVSVPGALLVDVLKRSQGDVTITIDGEKVVFSWEGGTIEGYLVGGNYPPIARLFPELRELGDTPAGVLVDPVKLARLAKLTRPARRSADRRVIFELASNARDGSIRASPIVAMGDLYTVLIQPERIR